MKRTWTEQMTRRLRREYPKAVDLRVLAKSLAVTLTAMKSKANILGIRRKLHKRKVWKPSEVKVIRLLYPTTPTSELAARFRCSDSKVYCLANRLGLHKTRAFISEQVKKREPSATFVAKRFKKGNVPGNKGKKEWQFRSKEASEKCRQTQFKAGSIPHNARPEGYESIHADGYVYVKVPGYSKMQPKHRHVWQQHHGPIPPGHCIAFIDGDRTNCDISNLILITNAEKATRVTAAMTPEKKQQRLEKSLATRLENIRKDFLRIRWGLPPKTRLVKRWHTPEPQH